MDKALTAVMGLMLGLGVVMAVAGMAQVARPTPLVFTCPHCGATFATEEELNYHIQTEHPEVLPEYVSFSVEVYNIPSYAAGSYQWYIDYGGKKHGMVDPQGGVWTPIDSPIAVEDIPATGTLQATLHAGPYKAWTFSAPRAFRDGETYRFNLFDEFIEGPGIALKDLVIEPDYITVGEEASISVTAVNSGASSDTYDISFSVGSLITRSITVTLAPGKSKLVTIKVTPEVGRYSVLVDGLSGWLEVKEPYPDISQPKIESIGWAGGLEYRSGVYWRPFEGTILLPGLSQGQERIITAWFSPMSGTPGAISSPECTYLSNGLWSFTGKAILPRYIPQQMCSIIMTYHNIRCPVCGNVKKSRYFWGKTPEQYLRDYLEGHALYYCALGDQRHCGMTAAGVEVWTSQEPEYYTSPWPCLGAKVTLIFNVAIYAPTGGDPPYSLVKEWEINTGLFHIMQ